MKKPILLHYDEQIKAYVNSFPQGSTAFQIAEYCPVPSTSKIEDKFEYFYRPYSYTCNTQKFISYNNGPAGLNTERNPYALYRELIYSENFIDEFLRSVGARNALSPQRQMQIQALLFQMQGKSQDENNRSNCENYNERRKQRAKLLWQKLTHFMIKEDPRIRNFVYNQFRFLTGQQQVKRQRKKMFKNSKANRVNFPLSSNIEIEQGQDYDKLVQSVNYPQKQLPPSTAMIKKQMTKLRNDAIFTMLGTIQKSKSVPISMSVLPKQLLKDTKTISSIVKSSIDSND